MGVACVMDWRSNRGVVVMSGVNCVVFCVVSWWFVPKQIGLELTEHRSDA